MQPKQRICHPSPASHDKVTHPVVDGEKLTGSGNLDGAGINMVGASNINLASETVGALNFDRGSRVFLTSQGTGDAILTALSATRAAAGAGAGTGRGTLVFQPAAASRREFIRASKDDAALSMCE